MSNTYTSTPVAIFKVSALTTSPTSGLSQLHLFGLSINSHLQNTETKEECLGILKLSTFFKRSSSKERPKFHQMKTLPHVSHELAQNYEGLSLLQRLPEQYTILQYPLGQGPPTLMIERKRYTVI